MLHDNIQDCNNLGVRNIAQSQADLNFVHILKGLMESQKTWRETVCGVRWPCSLRRNELPIYKYLQYFRHRNDDAKKTSHIWFTFINHNKTGCAEPAAAQHTWVAQCALWWLRSTMCINVIYIRLNIEQEQVHLCEQSMCWDDLRASLLGVNSFHITSTCKLHALSECFWCVYKGATLTCSDG